MDVPSLVSRSQLWQRQLQSPVSVEKGERRGEITGTRIERIKTIGTRKTDEEEIRGTGKTEGGKQTEDKSLP